MNPKPLLLQASARKAISAIGTYYVNEGGMPPALGFHSALRKAFNSIGFAPAMGSRRWADELKIHRLRHWRLSKYPHQVFYVETEDQVRILDVIHERRDLGQPWCGLG